MANEKTAHAKRALTKAVTFTIEVKAYKVSEVGTFSSFEFISVKADNVKIKEAKVSEFRSALYIKCGSIAEDMLGTITEKKAQVKLF